MPKLKNPTQQRGALMCALIRQKARMAGLNVENLAPRVGMTPRTMYNRLNAPENFTHGELTRIFGVLDFTPEEKLNCLGD